MLIDYAELLYDLKTKVVLRNKLTEREAKRLNKLSEWLAWSYNSNS